MKKLLLVAVIALAGCTDADEAKKALINSGYTDVKIQGYSILGCSEDDLYRTEFTAKGLSGQQVSGVVCGGFWKGSTIRTF
ncbi:hypothetical protein F3J34_07940 [Klebsiella sp. Ap-873]|nr:hypothetical protein [Klebsiella sp. Ap-873]